MSPSRSRRTKSFVLISSILTLSGLFLSPAVLAQGPSCERVLADVSIRDAQGDSFYSLNWFDRLFVKSEKETSLIESERIIDHIANKSSAELARQFLEYAKNANVKYKLESGVFVILPDRQASPLNQFVESVSQLQTEGLGQEIRFVFSPAEAFRFVGCYIPSDSTIHVSLKSIFTGVPSSTEVHEFLHMKHDLSFKNGNDFLFRISLFPSRFSYLLSPSFTYSRMLSADELITQSSDLRLVRPLLKRAMHLGRKARKILFSNVRHSIKVLYENNQIINSSVNEGLSFLTSNQIKLKVAIKQFPNGREYVSAQYSFVNSVKAQWINLQAVNLAKQFLDEENSVSQKEEAYAQLVLEYTNHMNKMYTLNSKLIKISKEMFEKSKDDTFLTDPAFFALVDQYREIVKSGSTPEASIGL